MGMGEREEEGEGGLGGKGERGGEEERGKERERGRRSGGGKERMSQSGPGYHTLCGCIISYLSPSTQICLQENGGIAPRSLGQ